MILLLDNYDSFTWNVFQLLATIGAEVEVVRNDAITVAQVGELAPAGIVVSPGPGTPHDAGVSCDVVRHAADAGVPLLGICLGMQCIGEVFGAVIDRAGELVHGKTSEVSHDGEGLFHGVPTPMQAVRYHSLAVRADTVPHDLQVTATTARGLVMGLRHRNLPIEGVQFHPESIMSEHGEAILTNFLAATRGRGLGPARVAGGGSR